MSEDPATLAAQVASILDGGPTPEERMLPRGLQEIARIRSAARRILEAELEAADEARMLMALARQAARAELPMWALEAIVAELRGPDITPTLPRDFVQAQGQLHRAGFARCPLCSSRVLSDVELRDDARRRTWAAEEVARWKGAVRS